MKNKAKKKFLKRFFPNDKSISIRRIDWNTSFFVFKGSDIVGNVDFCPKRQQFINFKRFKNGNVSGSKKVSKNKGFNQHRRSHKRASNNGRNAKTVERTIGDIIGFKQCK